MVTFDHIIVLLNPAGTSAPRSLKRVSELQALFPSTTVDVLYTSPEGRAASQQLLATEAERLGSNALLCVAGGDGTVGMAVETLLTHPHVSEDARHATVLPLWGGNANDLATMLNGSSKISLKQLFERASRRTIHPLQVSLTDKDGHTKVHIATCYVSFGGTAFATKKIAEPAHRNHPLRKFSISRFILESVTTFTAFFRSPGFRIEEEGEERTIYERTISNGARFAKVVRMPVKLDDDAFFMYTLENRGLLSTPIEFLSLGRQTGNNMHRKHVMFTLRDAMLAQLDGELYELGADTTVTIEPSRQELSVLTTRLAAKDAHTVQ